MRRRPVPPQSVTWDKNSGVGGRKDAICSVTVAACDDDDDEVEDVVENWRPTAASCGRGAGPRNSDDDDAEDQSR